MPSVGWNAYWVLLFISWSLVACWFCLIPWFERLCELVTWSSGMPETVVRMIVLSFIVIVVIIVFILLLVFIFVIFVVHIIVVCTVMVVCVSEKRVLVVF